MPKTKIITLSKSTTSTKKISNKRNKDPNAPKRYRTAYILFSVEKRDEIKNENPGLSAKEIVAELGAQWKAADAATKQRFQKLSDTEKVEYEEKMAAYKSEKNDKESAKENQKKKKSSKKNEVMDDANEDSMED
ncbi:unnamed protein product [Rotaria sp. Silwood1]|nr:unnamed protein product [Rotaria sp. Silwood1]CAF3382586.1 unnamed protein product [Rotaria sp. Silwood1]CAF3389593.1 unnamed protein product [Rotaria sp. Silwood1]CAF4693420.1 unnamed protein product [Rotaria sp. Silwood1]CAF4872577.1 unnamed protein product [Rotaria sp. Silwood1]